MACVLGETIALGPVSVAGSLPPAIKGLGAQLDGYATTKWISEAVLNRVVVEHGVLVYVRRPVSITGDGAPEPDVMGAVLNYSRILGSVPALKRNSNGSTDGADLISDDSELRVLEAFDFIPVDDVAENLSSNQCGTGVYTPLQRREGQNTASHTMLIYGENGRKSVLRDSAGGLDKGSKIEGTRTRTIKAR
ncbi:hypothetical protein EKO27_g9339 [Xylaria grammica]|uniref:Thioester reductase (TE) domain-containing protein n=1 Tax=Xylaria grammica TaxID=363999 RepID=A0A439CUF4_9PEZI|nr:hypothetical protein EKO27_g9339 [Xylaria grammica]